MGMDRGAHVMINKALVISPQRVMQHWRQLRRWLLKCWALVQHERQKQTWAHHEATSWNRKPGWGASKVCFQGEGPQKATGHLAMDASLSRAFLTASGVRCQPFWTRYNLWPLQKMKASSTGWIIRGPDAWIREKGRSRFAYGKGQETMQTHERQSNAEMVKARWFIHFILRKQAAFFSVIRQEQSPPRLNSSQASYTCIADARDAETVGFSGFWWSYERNDDVPLAGTGHSFAAQCTGSLHLFHPGTLTQLSNFGEIPIRHGQANWINRWGSEVLCMYDVCKWLGIFFKNFLEQ